MRILLLVLFSFSCLGASVPIRPQYTLSSLADLALRPPLHNDTITVIGPQGGAFTNSYSLTNAADGWYYIANPAGGLWHRQNWDGDVRAAGAVPGDSLEDTSAIQAAVNVSSANRIPLLICGNGDYLIDHILLTNGCVIRGDGSARIVGTNVGANDVMFRAQPAIQWVEGVANVAHDVRSLAYDGGAPVMGVASVITLSNAAVQFQRGEWFKLVADDRVVDFTREEADSAFLRIGEWVMSLSNSVGVVYSTPLVETNYATNIRLVKPGYEKFVFSDLVVAEQADSFGDPSSYRLAYFQAELAVAPEFRNLTIQNGNGRAVRLAGCINALVDGLKVENLENLIPVYNAVGYGVDDSASQGTRVQGMFAINCRHAYTTTEYPSVVNGEHFEAWGRTIGAIISDSVAVNCPSGGFDTHAGSVGVLFLNCVVRNPWLGNGTLGSGYSLRGWNHRIQDCEQYGGALAVTATSQYGPSGGHIIDGLRAYKLQQAFFYATPEQSSGGTNIAGVTLRNCRGEMDYGDGLTATPDSPLRSNFSMNNLTVEDSRFVVTGTTNATSFLRWGEPFGDGLVKMRNVEVDLAGNVKMTLFSMLGNTAMDVDGFRVRTTNTSAVSLILSHGQDLPILASMRNVRVDGTLTVGAYSPNDVTTNYFVDAIWSGGSTRLQTAVATTNIVWPARHVTVALLDTNVNQTITLPLASLYDPGDILAITRTDRRKVNLVVACASGDFIINATTVWLGPQDTLWLTAHPGVGWRWNRDSERITRHFSGSATIASTDGHLLVTASFATNILTLPAVPLANYARHDFRVTKVDASTNLVTIDGGGNTINGQPTLTLGAQWETAQLKWDPIGGTNWIAAVESDAGLTAEDVGDIIGTTVAGIGAIETSFDDPNNLVTIDITDQGVNTNHLALQSVLLSHLNSSLTFVGTGDLEIPSLEPGQGHSVLMTAVGTQVGDFVHLDYPVDQTANYLILGAGVTVDNTISVWMQNTSQSSTNAAATNAISFRVWANPVSP